MADESFNNIIRGNTPVLVDFHAEWCGPCKSMKPVLEEVKRKMGDNLRILKIDIDKHPHLSNQYQVQAVPTLVLFSEGQMIWRKSGMLSSTDLLKILKSEL